MADTNFVIEGNLTRDPELTLVGANETHKVRLGIAVNRRWENAATKQTEERVSYFTVEAWRDLADHINDTCVKGMRVLVTGTFEQQTWETEGEKRSAVVFTALALGPSLRWATANVNKTGGNGSAGSSAATEPPPSDEEPF